MIGIPYHQIPKRVYYPAICFRGKKEVVVSIEILEANEKKEIELDSRALLKKIQFL